MISDNYNSPVLLPTPESTAKQALPAVEVIREAVLRGAVQKGLLPFEHLGETRQILHGSQALERLKQYAKRL